MVINGYVEYALDHYQAPVFTHDEFKADLHKVIILKKLFRRFTNDCILNERVVLNTIILILNQFGVEGANNIMFYKIATEHHSVLKTFLAYLHSYHENQHVPNSMEYDDFIINKLKDITCRSCLV